ncbi:MAG: hypothetical protein F4122_09880 [Gammaproteobacteria bacterium]|nr:hypothetical protein [Gammaproteobacteria bacterium]MYE29395.1 hypothetical protein [Gammaproteobacteria bacterium]MYI02801.1 hypothetical protein [Gammaproteobacteria bacterium]
MKKIVFTLLALILAGCATAPRQYQFDNSQSFDASMDEIWPEIIEFFAENNLSISTLERNSGLVAVDNLRLHILEFDRYADCQGMQGSLLEVVADDNRTDLNVFVRERSTDGTTMTVNTRFQVFIEGTWLSSGGWQSCVSKGTLENAIFEQIATNINLPTVNLE